MKVEVKSEKPRFQPIELNITIESKEELASLYARFNIARFNISPEKVETSKLDLLPFDIHVDQRVADMVWREITEIIELENEHVQSEVRQPLIPESEHAKLRHALSEIAKRGANPITQYGYGIKQPWSRFADDVWQIANDALLGDKQE